MRKPKAVCVRWPEDGKIKRRWVRVNYVDNLIDEKGELNGCFEEDKMLITVVKNEEWKMTLYHEMVHAVISLSGLGKNMTAQYEEYLVLTMEALIERS
jgi:uncharacterized 2Fe-2S/4Fe-4S cluster protein (DUF4445 family)